jgi:hypothetical protein
MQAPYFEDTLDIILSHQPSPVSLQVVGRAWSEGCFIGRGGSYTQPSNSVLAADRCRALSVIDATAVRYVDAAFLEPLCLGETKTHTLEVRCKPLPR